MKKVLAIDSDAAVYPREFRRELVYRLPVFQDGPDGNRQFQLIHCLDEQATQAAVTAALQDADVVYVTGSGHGTYDQFAGSSGAIIWDRARLPASEVRGRIIHLLACRVGGLLGPDLVACGARAFWGYRAEFLYDADEITPEPIVTDAYARPFFVMDARIDEGILNGDSPDAIYERVRSYAMAEYYRYEASGETSSASWILANLINLNFPSTNAGDSNATI